MPTDGLRWENDKTTPLLSTTLEYQGNTFRTLADVTEKYGYWQTVPKEPCRLSGESLQRSTLEFLLGDNPAEKDLDWPPTWTESPAPRSSIAEWDEAAAMPPTVHLSQTNR
jgi:hypothetical protein